MTGRARLDGLALDHVLYGGRELSRLEAVFEGYGLPTTYGGAHGNGVTHNAVVGFADGSYAELLALYDADRESPRRDALLRSNVGPCGWALETADAAGVAERFAARGVPVEGPVSLGRERPDGVRTSWKLVYLGDGEPGAALPFLIEDVTPRTRRIEPTPGVAETALTGVARVVVGTAHLGEATDVFRRAFDLDAPVSRRDGTLGADLAVFPGSPLALATAEDGPLAARTDRFGDLVCAVLFGTEEFATTAERCGVVATERWCDRRVGWLPTADGVGGRVGVLER